MLELPNFSIYGFDNNFVELLKIHPKAFEYLLESLDSREK